MKEPSFAAWLVIHASDCFLLRWRQETIAGSVRDSSGAGLASRFSDFCDLSTNATTKAQVTASGIYTSPPAAPG